MRLHLSASVQDVVVRDLRARPEHSLVLIPNGGEDYCSIEVAYTSYVDQSRAGPRLNLLVQVGEAHGWVQRRASGPWLATLRC